jgi:hypothetical protein
MLLRKRRQGAKVDDVADHGIIFMLPQWQYHAPQYSVQVFSQPCSANP